MILMRPGVKVKLWTGGYTNRPAVNAPWLLKLVSVSAILSVVGAILYVALLSMGAYGFGDVRIPEAVYISILHFLVPIAIAYTVITNSPLSRFLILGYFLTLYVSTLAGRGFLGELSIDPTLKAVTASIALIAIVIWLFFSPKMRLYYALVSHKPVPSDLEARAISDIADSGINPKWRAAFDWIADHLETVVLLGFIVLSIYAYVSTGA